MSHFILAYHGGGNTPAPEDGKKLMEEWKAWVGNLGDKMINPGTPLGSFKTVSNEGISDTNSPTPFMGFSIVEANSLDAALEISKSCPHLKIGTINVAEIKSMS
jgi:hypothetical protein